MNYARENGSRSTQDAREGSANRHSSPGHSSFTVRTVLHQSRLFRRISLRGEQRFLFFVLVFLCLRVCLTR